jgi:hypothetical protein
MVFTDGRLLSLFLRLAARSSFSAAFAFFASSAAFIALRQTSIVWPVYPQNMHRTGGHCHTAATGLAERVELTAIVPNAGPAGVAMPTPRAALLLVRGRHERLRHDCDLAAVGVACDAEAIQQHASGAGDSESGLQCFRRARVDRLERPCDTVDVGVDVLERRRLALDLLGDAGEDVDCLERVDDRDERVEHRDEQYRGGHALKQGVGEHLEQEVRFHAVGLCRDALEDAEDLGEARVPFLGHLGVAL